MRQIAVCILNIILGIGSQVERERSFGDSHALAGTARGRDHPFSFFAPSNLHSAKAPNPAKDAAGVGVATAGEKAKRETPFSAKTLK
jgi:hypothetical protein